MRTWVAPWIWDSPPGVGALHRAAGTLTVSTTDQQGDDRTAALLALSAGDLLRFTAPDGRWWTYSVDAPGTASPDGFVHVPVSPGGQSAHAAPLVGDVLTVLAVDVDAAPEPAVHSTPADTAYARSMWPDAGNLPDDVLSSLLTLSWESCERYVPADERAAVTTPELIPERWKLANVSHARDCWTATRRDTGDVLGFDQYAVTVRPLAASVRALLRPSRGVPVVG